MKQLAIWLKQGIIHILAAFKLKSSVVTTPEVSTTKPQKVKEIMNHPDVQRIPNTKIRHRSKNDSRNGDGDNSKTDETSTAAIKNIELEDAISKQQSFLRKFT